MNFVDIVFAPSEQRPTLLEFEIKVMHFITIKWLPKHYAKLMDTQVCLGRSEHYHKVFNNLHHFSNNICGQTNDTQHVACLTVAVAYYYKFMIVICGGILTDFHFQFNKLHPTLETV